MKFIRFFLFFIFVFSFSSVSNAFIETPTDENDCVLANFKSGILGIINFGQPFLLDDDLVQDFQNELSDEIEIDIILEEPNAFHAVAIFIITDEDYNMYYFYIFLYDNNLEDLYVLGFNNFERQDGVNIISPCGGYIISSEYFSDYIDDVLEMNGLPQDEE